MDIQDGQDNEEHNRETYFSLIFFVILFITVYSLSQRGRVGVGGQIVKIMPVRSISNYS